MRTSALERSLPDFDAILDDAEAHAKESTPKETIDAVRAVYEADDYENKRGEAFELAAVMIGDRELANLSPALDATVDTISALRRRVSALPDEIRTLDDANQKSREEIEKLLGDVEARKRAIEKARSGRGPIARAFTAVFLYEPTLEIACAQDEKIRSLSNRINELGTESTERSIRIIRDRTPRPELEAQMRALERTADRIYESLAASPPRARGPGLLLAHEADAKRARREALRSVLEETVRVLEAIKADAEALGVVLDAVIDHMRGSVRALDRAIEEGVLIPRTPWIRPPDGDTPATSRR